MINLSNKFKLFKKRDNYKESNLGLTYISPLQARNFITQYNVYFSNFIPFNTQYEYLERLNFPLKTTIYLYTDYKENKEILLNKVKSAYVELKKKNESATVTKLNQLTRVSKPICKEYVESLEPNRTMSLFDVELENVS